ncbi:MAG: hypothetical protein ACI9M9_000186 [Flavobacteriaceae bacterium]|jgi:hypothetical protein
MKGKIIVLLMLASSMVSSQELESILIAAGKDANALTQYYVEPALKGLIYSMNSGWATTAKTHDKFGFDITIGGNLSFVPSDQKSFLFDPNEYEFLALPNGGSTTLPTLMSENSNQNILDVRVPTGNGTFKVASFEMPGGITKDLPASAVPAPMIQVGFGLPTRTDIKLRFIPSLEYGDNVKAGMFGLGFQHDLTQYLGPLDNLPLSVSGLVAYSNMHVRYTIDDGNDLDSVKVTNGEGEFKLNTFTIEALGSLDFSLVTLFAAVGYGTGSTSLKLKGDYELQYKLEDNAGNSLGNVTETISNPINIKANNGSVKGTLGARLNLSIFKIFADYTFQEYSTFSGGIAISVR